MRQHRTRSSLNNVIYQCLYGDTAVYSRGFIARFSAHDASLPPMLILAIDTALDACAAAVLDTGANRLIAVESQTMKRGHAEALMPLIARVMKESALPFAALDRIAVTTGPGSFTGLRVGLSAARGIALAAHKAAVGVTTLSAYAAPVVSEGGEAAGDLGDRCAARPGLLPGGQRQRQLADPAARRADRGSARSIPLRRAASGRQCRDNPRRTLARRGAAAREDRFARPRPTSTGWRGSAPPSIQPPRRRARSICARPTPNLR